MKVFLFSKRLFVFFSDSESYRSFLLEGCFLKTDLIRQARILNSDQGTLAAYLLLGLAEKLDTQSCPTYLHKLNGPPPRLRELFRRAEIRTRANLAEAVLECSSFLLLLVRHLLLEAMHLLLLAYKALFFYIFTLVFYVQVPVISVH